MWGFTVTRTAQMKTSVMLCLVHTADTDKTRQSCLVLSVFAVWTELVISQDCPRLKILKQFCPVSKCGVNWVLSCPDLVSNSHTMWLPIGLYGLVSTRLKLARLINSYGDLRLRQSTAAYVRVLGKPMNSNNNAANNPVTAHVWRVIAPIIRVWICPA